MKGEDELIKIGLAVTIVDARAWEHRRARATDLQAIFSVAREGAQVFQRSERRGFVDNA